MVVTTNRSLKARIVHVVREEGKTGLFYASSPDLKGLLVAERTLDALDRAIPQAIADLYAACGEEVFVARLDDDEDRLRSWVAVPVDVAKQSLAQRSSAERE